MIYVHRNPDHQGGVFYSAHTKDISSGGRIEGSSVVLESEWAKSTVSSHSNGVHIFVGCLFV